MFEFVLSLVFVLIASLNLLFTATTVSFFALKVIFFDEFLNSIDFDVLFNLGQQILETLPFLYLVIVLILNDVSVQLVEQLVVDLDLHAILEPHDFFLKLVRQIHVLNVPGPHPVDHCRRVLAILVRLAPPKLWRKTLEVISRKPPRLPLTRLGTGLRITLVRTLIVNQVARAFR